MRTLRIFLKTTFGLLFIAGLGYSFLKYSQTSNVQIWGLPLFLLVLLIFYYVVILKLVNRYISENTSKIIKDVSLNKTPDNSATVITDMDVLSREVERFARDKQKEIDGLQLRDNYRKEFMGNVAHELKTPLFTVQGYIFTLMDGAKNDPEVLNKYLEGAAKGVDRLVNIVADLDMITELEYGALQLEKNSWDIVQLIRNVISLLEIKAQKRKISITLDRDYAQPIYVYADKKKIEQVLINILENSLKYGKKNGTTEIAVDPLSERKVLVRITDNGEGIAKNNLPRVFERFYRVDKSGSRKEGGSGLGLAIVKHIVEAHAEKIYVESQLGVGSEFSFTLQKISESDSYSIPENRE